MKKRALLVLFPVFFIFISGCVLQEDIKIKKDGESIRDSEAGIQEQPKHETLPSASQTPKLGGLCAGEEECDNYCYSYSFECEDYCRNHPENPTCQERFAFVYEEKAPESSIKVNKPSRQAGCIGTGTVKFTSPPRRLEDIGIIEPMGLMIDGHVTPIDHGYYYPPNWKREPTLSDLSDVLAPAAGVITQIQRMPTYFSTKNPDFEDYRVVLMHTCTFYTVYIHIYKLSPKIKEVIGDIPPSQNTYPNIEVSTGEVIGKAHAFDFSVHNEEITLPGFLVPEHYNREPWKIHTVDPFDYFTEPIRSQLLAKNIRTAEPLGGKIDYDIDGRLAGNWFKENTNGYRGVDSPDYWTTHLSLAYDALDAAHIIFSIGNFNGEAKQFGVKGNLPDPATVSVSAGLIKYELVEYDHLISDTNQYWDRISFARNLKAVNNKNVQGVALLQMIEDRKLKVEVFPGKTASEVSGFSTSATIYER